MGAVLAGSDPSQGRGTDYMQHRRGAVIGSRATRAARADAVPRAELSDEAATRYPALTATADPADAGAGTARSRERGY